jgi:hypothetical protein
MDRSKGWHMAVTETSISELLDQLNTRSIEDGNYKWTSEPIEPLTTYSISSVTGTVGPVEMVFGNNGSNLFVLSYDGVGGANYGYIVSYSLSTPYDIDTITSSTRATFNLGGVTALNGLAFNDDGMFW